MVKELMLKASIYNMFVAMNRVAWIIAMICQLYDTAL